MSTTSADGPDVRHMADLARIDLTAEEEATFAREMEEVVAYVRLLREADVEGIEPTAHAMPLTNVLREDVPVPCLDRERILANAPAVINDDSFRVPAILPDDEEGA